jgi:hypothetical protein
MIDKRDLAVLQFIGAVVILFTADWLGSRQILFHYFPYGEVVIPAVAFVFLFRGLLSIYTHYLWKLHPSTPYLGGQWIYQTIDKNMVYVFSWDNVPGSDSEILLRFLRDNLNIGWVEDAEIHKDEDSKAISIIKDKNTAKIMMSAQNKEAFIETSNGITYNLKINEEDGKLNMYTIRQKGFYGCFMVEHTANELLVNQGISYECGKQPKLETENAQWESEAAVYRGKKLWLVLINSKSTSPTSGTSPPHLTEEHAKLDVIRKKSQIEMKGTILRVVDPDGKCAYGPTEMKRISNSNRPLLDAAQIAHRTYGSL